MQYSRKGWWISKTVGVAVALTGMALVVALRPGRPIAGLVMVAVFAISYTLGTRAFFYRDEIERQTRMRCWYFGSQIGVLIAALAVTSIFSFGIPAPDTIINLWLHGRPRLPNAMFAVGVATGIVTLGLSQAICALLMRAFLFLPKRES